MHYLYIFFVHDKIKVCANFYIVMVFQMLFLQFRFEILTNKMNFKFRNICFFIEIYEKLIANFKDSSSVNDHKLI